MKSRYKQLIGRWKFNFFPPDELCSETGYDNALLAGMELRAVGQEWDNPSLALIRVPRDVLFDTVQAEVDPHSQIRRWNIDRRV